MEKQRGMAAEDLALINALAKAELTAEQVYVFTLRLCDNEVDRDFERFDGEALERLGGLFVGKSGIFDLSLIHIGRCRGKRGGGVRWVGE